MENCGREDSLFKYKTYYTRAYHYGYSL